MTTRIEADRIMDIVKHVPGTPWEKMRDVYPPRTVGRCSTVYRSEKAMHFTHEDDEWVFRLDRTEECIHMTLLFGKRAYNVERVTGDKDGMTDRKSVV